MELSTVIDKRASIRNFDDKGVSIDFVMKVLESGNKAPTAGNIQPWEFVIVTDKDKKKDIVNATYVGAEIHSKIEKYAFHNLGYA
jgi:nitroreductase